MPKQPNFNTDRWLKCVAIGDPTVHLADVQQSATPTHALCGAQIAYTTSTPTSLPRVCETCRSAMIRLVLHGPRERK